jgi:hypothetical protein
MKKVNVNHRIYPECLMGLSCLPDFGPLNRLLKEGGGLKSDYFKKRNIYWGNAYCAKKRKKKI